MTITPEEFRRRWLAVAGDEPFVRYEREMFEGLSVPREAISFLLAVGLPESAAPFLTMDQPSRSPLPTIAQIWKLPVQFARFRMIGFDGAGSPLCLEEENGRVVILDHDNSFVVQLVNSSIPQLAESLLAYQEFLAGVFAANGDDAWLDNAIPPPLRIRLAQELERIDPGAVEPGSFWSEELRRLQSQ